MPNKNIARIDNLEKGEACIEHPAGHENNCFAPTSFTDRLPPGLDQAILRQLTAFVGRQHAVSRARLVADLSYLNVNERQVRQQIKVLRRAGHLIGSAAGEEGGYYLITTLEEFNHFMQAEYLAKIKDMSETAQAMTCAAKRLWGEATLQMPMF